MRKKLAAGIAVFVLCCAGVGCASTGSSKAAQIIEKETVSVIRIDTSDETQAAQSAESTAAETETQSGGTAPQTTAEKAETAQTANAGGSGKKALLCDSKTLYTYEDMSADLTELAAEYPELVKVNSLGDTADGRQLAQMVIGSPTASQQVLIFASIHAREYLTTQLTMKQCEQFLKDLSGGASYRGKTYGELMNDTAVRFLPMVNPDGVTISQKGLDGLNREETKTRIRQIAAADHAENLSSYLRKWKSNADGIDLNRNFDAKWDQYDDHVGHPSADHYKGTAPATTAEAKMLIDLTEKYPFRRTISYHTQGGMVYWYFEQTGELKDMSLKFAQAIGNVTGYQLDANYQALDPAGYKDWAISKKKIPSLTIEVGSGDNPVDPAQLPGIYERNKNVWAETLYTMQ